MGISLKLSTQRRQYIKNLGKYGDMFAQMLDDLADNLLYKDVKTGLMAGAPTTASTQATGAGNTTWNVNVDKGIVVIDGATGEIVQSNDFSVHAGSNLLANGQSCVATLVVKKDGSSFSLQAVKGAVATTGSQVPPTAAAVDAAVGAGIPYIKLSDCTLNRTGDLTVTQSQDNTKRDVDPTFR